MNTISWAVLCIAYIVGVLLGDMPRQALAFPFELLGALSASVAAALVVPRLWPTGPRSKVWLMTGLVVSLAVLYVQWRIPTPSAADISQLLRDSDRITEVALKGNIETAPRLTRAQRFQFNMQAIAVQETLNNKQVNEGSAVHTVTTGKVYVTVPRAQGEALYPGQTVTVIGTLYRPKSASLPGSFDFRRYLVRQGIFSGFNGKQVLSTANPSDPPLSWLMQQRIIDAQQVGLGYPEGPLLSAMVLGKRAVDVPYVIQDQFRQVGLSHALAASGAQVSLLLGVVLVLTKAFAMRLRLIVGLVVLIGYVSLTGIEPAVLRAAVMGAFALTALLLERRLNSLGALLFAAVLLLVIYPLWGSDLGFQLSFLATLGLLVTVPILTKWLDWLPNTVAPLIAVSIAAYIWTLPLQIFSFGIISPYSILINILISPLILVISIGGMFGAAVALAYPPAGSFVSGLLYYPTHWFIQTAEWGSQLPGNQLAVGTISLIQVFFIYGLYLLIWWQPHWWKYWWIVGGVSLSAVIIPTWAMALNVLQFTIVDSSSQPILVIQDKGTVGLVSAAIEADVNYKLLPFLQKQGINHIDWAIAPILSPDTLKAWQGVAEKVSIQRFYSTVDAERVSSSFKANVKEVVALPINLSMSLKSVNLKLLAHQSLAMQVKVADHSWLLLSDLPDLEKQSSILSDVSAAQILYWPGKPLSPQLLDRIQPEIAIATSDKIPKRTEHWLKQKAATIYAIGRDSVIQWTPQQGLRAELEEKGTVD